MFYLSGLLYIILWPLMRFKEENMTESRCGLICSECSYKETFNCGGCTSLENPFWGECKVKKCCEKDNSVDHCGKCNAFPCVQLTEFSYDPEHG
jgi:hypothetical protein